MANNDIYNIVVESHIPFIKGLLEPFGNVRYIEPTLIDADAVADADALFVRTRTRCDKALLANSKCKFIATATIGTDHIDLPWCASQGITVANAPGCNAPAVAQYVFASLLRLINRPISQYTIGVVGVGHVGSIVERWARELGMQVLVNDPPRQQAEGGDQWSTLADIARNADIITFHTPLDATTRHLVDADFVGSLERAPIIINAARGAVVDTDALIAALETGKVSHAVIDCWEGEPKISSRLLQLADIATSHIAGYSREGKIRATQMTLNAFAKHIGVDGISMPDRVPEGAAEKVTEKSIMQSYDPMVDTMALRVNFSDFESLRNNYNLRNEVS